MHITLASGTGVSFARTAYAAGVFSGRLRGGSLFGPLTRRESFRAAYAAKRSIRARTRSGQAMVASANTSAKRPPSLRGTNLPQETPSS